MASSDDAALATALSVAQTACDAAYDLLASGKYRSDEITRTLCMLAATITDGLQAVVVLVPSHGQAHADTIVRSMLEALGDLYHLVADPCYLDRLELTSAQNVKKSSEDFIRDRHSDPDVADVVEFAKAKCREANATITSLTGRSKPIKPSARVQAPGLPTEVARVFALECFDAHHDLTVLERRYFDGPRISAGDTLSVGEAIEALGHAVLITSVAVDKYREFGQFDPALYDRKATELFTATVQLTAQVDEAYEGVRMRDSLVKRGHPNN